MAYEEKNNGSKFRFEESYSTILAVLGITFLHSAAMPIVYPIATIFFFLTFWTDHYLLLRFHRRPVQYDKYLAERFVRYFKYILFMHIVGTLLMFGMTPIFEMKPKLLNIYYPLVILCFVGFFTQATNKGPSSSICSCITCCFRICISKKK